MIRLLEAEGGELRLVPWRDVFSGLLHQGDRGRGGHKQSNSSSVCLELYESDGCVKSGK